MAEDQLLKKYNLLLLINPLLAEKEPEAGLILNFENLIKTHGGEILKASSASKRRLSYPIKKENQALMLDIEFKINPEKVENLSKSLRLDHRVLRFDVTVAQKIETARRFGMSATVEKLPQTPTPATQSEVQEPEVKEKTFAQKLEQILRGNQ